MYSQAEIDKKVEGAKRKMYRLLKDFCRWKKGEIIEKNEGSCDGECIRFSKSECLGGFQGFCILHLVEDGIIEKKED